MDKQTKEAILKEFYATYPDRPQRFLNFLNSLPENECEHKHPDGRDYDIWCSECGKSSPARFLVDRNVIAKRVIEEYIEQTLKDAEKGCPVAREFRAIFNGCIDWLDGED